MTAYEVRYLKRDGSWKKTISFEAESDAEAKAYVIDYHGQRSSELWRADKLLHRRVSPKLLAAENGIYPSCCRWPSLSNWSIENFAKQCSPLSDAEFDALGHQSTTVFDHLMNALLPHDIYLWPQGYGPPHPQPRRAVRYSSHPSFRRGDIIYGMDNCTVWSDFRDGRDIVDDLGDLLKCTLAQVYRYLGTWEEQSISELAGPIVRVATELTLSIRIDWRVETSGGFEINA